MITVNHEIIKENMIKEFERRLPSINEKLHLEHVIDFINYINSSLPHGHCQELQIQDLLKDAITEVK